MQGEIRIAPGISNEVLTELALNSAIALDKQLREQPGNRAVVGEFFGVLGRIVNISQDHHPEARLVSDPRKIGVVSRAVRHIENVSTVQELVAKINQMSATYKDATASKTQIELIRDFCIALHKELLAGAYRSYEDERKRDSGKQNAARLS